MREAGERMSECYECAKLAELVAENSQLRVRVDEFTAERDQWREAAGNAHEMWEQADTERNELKASVDELTKQIELIDFGICSTCKFAGIHDGKRWPGREFKGRMYCIAWSDGYMAEWTKPDGFCHMWKPKEGEE